MEDLELKRNVIENQIHFLYQKVIEGFRRGELLVYAPNIFCHLTETRFRTWIIKNNEKVALILE